MWYEQPKNSGVGSRNRGEVTTLHGWDEGKRSGTRGCRMSLGVDNITQIIYKECPSLQFFPSTCISFHLSYDASSQSSWLSACRKPPTFQNHKLDKRTLESITLSLSRDPPRRDLSLLISHDYSSSHSHEFRRFGFSSLPSRDALNLVIRCRRSRTFVAASTSLLKHSSGPNRKSSPLRQRLLRGSCLETPSVRDD
jgi:hypothetical protein